MKKTLLLSTLLLTLAMIGCKPRQGGTTPTPEGAVRLSVSFYSIGSGINHEALKAYDAFIADYTATHKVDLKYDVVHWGREGETDYCFPMTGIKAKDQAEFVAETRKALEGKEHIHINENVACRKGRP